jgi:ubiquinone/menaquinone biosynthesis C-methylase UbiE
MNGHEMKPNQDRLRAWRREALPPAGTLVQTGLSDGMTLADIGCGAGYFALPAAGITGKTGCILAIDVSEEKLEDLRRSADENGLDNIRTFCASGNATGLPDDAADMTLISNVLHEVEDPESFLREAARITREGGKVIVIEWQNHKTEYGPPVDERIAEDRLEEMLRGCGLDPLQRYHFGNLFYAITAARR